MVVICVEIRDRVDWMDKNKSRTDLLAAGRKKVLFRLLCLFIVHKLGFSNLKLLLFTVAV